MNEIEQLIDDIAEQCWIKRDMSVIAAYSLARGVGDNELLEQTWSTDIDEAIRSGLIHQDTISMFRQLKAMIYQYNREFSKDYSPTRSEQCDAIQKAIKDGSR